MGNPEKGRLLNGTTIGLFVDLSTWRARDFLDGKYPPSSSAKCALFNAKRFGLMYKGLFPKGDLDNPATRTKFREEVNTPKATKGNCKAARKVDKKYHGTQPGAVDPIEARLRAPGSLFLPG